MFIKHFEVEGFKSLAHIELQNLDAINVFHGLNDAGKSNLLQAIDLFAQLLPLALDVPLSSMHEGETRIAVEQLRPYRYTTLFRQQNTPREVLWYADIRCGALDLPPLRMTLTDEVAADAGEKLWLRIYWDAEPSGEAILTLKEKVHGFNLIPAERRLTEEMLGDTIEEEDFLALPLRRPEVTARNLKRVLFDASASPDPQQRQRFQRLQKLLNDTFKVGELWASLESAREIPRLFTSESLRHVRDITLSFVREDLPAPVPSTDVGSGVQQVLLLLGQILFNSVYCIGIEEPEMNLSPEWQGILMATLCTLVTTQPGGLEQIFITSHSPAFEFRDNFYLVEYENQATQVARFPLKERERLFGPQQPLGEQRRQRLNSQNQVTLYYEVIEDLGLKYGDMVFFSKNETGRWELKHEDEVVPGLQEELGVTYTD